MAAAKRAHGGKRKNAGRPRSVLPEELVKRIGKAPLGKPLRMARWYQDLIAALTELCVLEGRQFTKQLELVRASAGAAGRVLPHDIIYTAGERLDRDERDMGQSAGGGSLTSREEDNVVARSRAVRRDPSRG
jgi:hypothetical protein